MKKVTLRMILYYVKVYQHKSVKFIKILLKINVRL